MSSLKFSINLEVPVEILRQPAAAKTSNDSSFPWGRLIEVLSPSIAGSLKPDEPKPIPKSTHTGDKKAKDLSEILSSAFGVKVSTTDASKVQATMNNVLAEAKVSTADASKVQATMDQALSENKPDEKKAKDDKGMKELIELMGGIFSKMGSMKAAKEVSPKTDDQKAKTDEKMENLTDLMGGIFSSIGSKNPVEVTGKDFQPLRDVIKSDPQFQQQTKETQDNVNYLTDTVLDNIGTEGGREKIKAALTVDPEKMKQFLPSYKVLDDGNCSVNKEDIAKLVESLFQNPADRTDTDQILRLFNVVVGDMKTDATPAKPEVKPEAKPEEDKSVRGLVDLLGGIFAKGLTQTSGDKNNIDEMMQGFQTVMGNVKTDTTIPKTEDKTESEDDKNMKMFKGLMSGIFGGIDPMTVSQLQQQQRKAASNNLNFDTEIQVTADQSPAAAAAPDTSDSKPEVKPEVKDESDETYKQISKAMDNPVDMFQQITKAMEGLTQAGAGTGQGNPLSMFGSIFGNLKPQTVVYEESVVNTEDSTEVNVETLSKTEDLDPELLNS